VFGQWAQHKGRQARKSVEENSVGIAILLKNIAEQLQLKDTKIHKAQRYQPSHDDDENPGNF
jgi:hypothetical protein